MPNHYAEHYPTKSSEKWFGTFVWRFEPMWKPFWDKPPLRKPQMHKNTNSLFKIWFSTHCAKYCSDNTNCYEDELHCSSLQIAHSIRKKLHTSIYLKHGYTLGTNLCISPGAAHAQCTRLRDGFVAHSAYWTLEVV